MKNKTKIGLEIHIPLDTKTKLFCNCSNEEEKTPNKNVCEVCLGLPGAKPRLNEEAVNKALLLAITLNCKINKTIEFARKTYFYPDLSKNFQITQYENPLAKNGTLEISNKKISINRLQIEEDPARIQHERNYSLIDYNRSGTPLIELVTAPEFENAQESIEFISRLTSILDYLDIHDPSQAIRTDVNISISGGNRVEIKNVSGNKSIEKAVNFELIRQKLKLKKSETIQQQTMHFDPVSGRTFTSREKESEEDYGYISEPDLSPLKFSKEKILEIKKSIPELPFQRYTRIKTQYKLKDFQAHAITLEKATADLFESLYKKFPSELLTNWIVVTLRKVLNYNKLKFSETKLSSEKIESILKKLSEKEITPRTAELVLRELIIKNKKVEEVLASMGQEKISNSELKRVVEEIIKNNKKAVQDYKAGKTKALQFLIGQVAAKTKGQINPIEIKKIVLEKLN